MKKNSFYVYRFLNKFNQVIYIGRTNNLKRRLEQEHFSKEGHLPRECYDECAVVEYMELSSESEMKIYELYLINKYNPRYNVMENRNDDFKFILEEQWTKVKDNDIMTKKEYKLYSFIVINSDVGYWRTTTDIDTLADGIKIKNRDTVTRMLESLARKSYIRVRYYGRKIVISHTLRDIKFPKEEENDY
ncbi:nucleotide excision repair endonuclease [Bacillus phage vB_BanS-Thrax3]|nr:nucleotide excision repair endonuclease [Bacillus phage vB_BanS-Thrax3]